jgi:hypothetical protein
MKKTRIAILIVLLTALAWATPQTDRIQQKAARAQQMVVDAKLSGRSVDQILVLLGKVKTAGQSGRLDEAERLLDQALLQLDPPVHDHSLFHGAKAVRVLGYDGHIMEPSLSRDGRTMFFNNLNDMKKENTDIHRAERVDGLTFRYLGKVGHINSEHLEGVPTTTTDGRIFFVSTRNYRATNRTLHQSTIRGGSAQTVEGDFLRNQKPWLIMDIDVSPDGEYLYLSDTKMSQDDNGPVESNLRIAEASGSEYRLMSSRLTEKLNTRHLEYAPCISFDGKELYFTRGFRVNGGLRTQIMVARRSSVDSPFSKAEPVPGIDGFVEAPTISPDGRYLYYHKRTLKGFRLFRVERK